jgi:hypothetical protein
LVQEDLHPVDVMPMHGGATGSPEVLRRLSLLAVSDIVSWYAELPSRYARPVMVDMPAFDDPRAGRRPSTATGPVDRKKNLLLASRNIQMLDPFARSRT